MARTRSVLGAASAALLVALLTACARGDEKTDHTAAPQAVAAYRIPSDPPDAEEDVAPPADVPGLTESYVRADFAQNGGALRNGRTTSLRSAIRNRIRFRKFVTWYAVCDLVDPLVCKRDPRANLVVVGLQSVWGGRKFDPRQPPPGGARILARMRVVNARAIPAKCTGLGGVLRGIGLANATAYLYATPTSVGATRDAFLFIDDTLQSAIPILKGSHEFWEHTTVSGSDPVHSDARHGDIADNKAGIQIREGEYGESPWRPSLVTARRFNIDPDLDDLLAGMIHAPCAPQQAIAGAKAAATPSVTSTSDSQVPPPSMLERPGSGLWISCMSGCCSTGGGLRFEAFSSANEPAKAGGTSVPIKP